MANRLQVQVGQFSDKGIKAENQDSVGFVIPTNPVLLETKGIVCAIADGISSSEAAKQASQACITGFMADYFSTPDSWSVKQSGSKVLTAINTWLHGQSQVYQDISRGLASTFSAVVIKSTTAHLFHVGDSRIYLYRQGQLEQLTTDHRIRLDNDQEYLGRAFGVDYCLDIDYKTVAIEAGDQLVLTTDGVHDVIGFKQFKQLLENDDKDLNQRAERLCQLAISQQTKDNVSCQIVQIEQLPIPDANEVFAQLTKLPFPPELEPGMILDGYRIIRELHASSTSQLYIAIDEETGDKVVLKTPSVNFDDDPAYLERFQLEEWIGRRINNNHVVKTIEQKRPRQFLYYVLEYIDGKTLEQWLDDQQTIDLKTVREWLPQLVSALRAFHRLGMLHQDLKPGNIMITTDGLIKVIDFGSTKIAGIAEITTPIQRRELLGTKFYTAPEYLLGETGTARSDQFSLGCIIYELLTGKLPYGNKIAKVTNPKTLNQLIYQPIVESVETIPQWVDKAIKKAVHPLAAHRYETLSEFEADLVKPNLRYLQEEFVPLIHRHPLAFWKIFCLVLVLSHLLWLYLFSQT